MEEILTTLSLPLIWVRSDIMRLSTEAERILEPNSADRARALLSWFRDSPESASPFEVGGRAFELKKLAAKGKGDLYHIVDVTDREERHDENRLNSNLLDSLVKVQSLFLVHLDRVRLLEQCMRELLHLTESHSGFITDLVDAPRKSEIAVHLELTAETVRSWNLCSVEFPASLRRYLIDFVVASGRPVLWSQPDSGSPHSIVRSVIDRVNSFVAIPLIRGDEVVGAVGLANGRRPYGQHLIRFLEPLLLLCTNLFEVNRRIEAHTVVEKQLRSSERFLNSVIDNLPHMVFIKDAHELRFTRMNRAGEELIGVSQAKLLGKNDYDLFPPDQAEFFTLKDREVINRRETVVIEEEPVKTKGGTRMLRTKKVPMYDERGEAQFLLGISEDITEWQVAQDMLRESEERFRMMADSAPVLIWFQMADGESYLNTRWGEFTGREIISGQGDQSDGWMESVHPDDIEILRGVYLTAFGRRGEFQSEFRLRRHDGVYRWMRDTGKPLFTRNGEYRGMLGTCVDISDLKQAELDISRARDVAEETSRLKSSFLANVSHEVRTPLNAVLGMTDLLMTSSLRDDQQELVECIRVSGENLLALINQILDFSKAEAGKLEVNPVAFSVARIVNDISRMFVFRFKQREIRFNVKLDGGWPDEVYGDAQRVKQILVNLVSNALKFTPVGGSISIGVMLDSEPKEDQYVLRWQVTDTGRGIPKPQQQRIFDAFFQIDGSHTREVGGTGLGLAICTELVNLLGGSITVQSEEGRGSTFSFTTPLSAVGVAPIADKIDESAGREGDPPPVKKLRILLVEDIPVNQLVARKLLEGEGHRVTLASNGKEAVDHFSSEEFDLILMDIQMPILDGLEATRRIRGSDRSRARQVPIVAMTAHALLGDRERCLEAGMDGYLTKPIRKSELVQLLLAYQKRLDGIPGFD